MKKLALFVAAALAALVSALAPMPVSALDFTWPNDPTDGYIKVVGNGQVVVWSYKAECHNIGAETTYLCDWGTRAFDTHGVQWPKWIPVLSKSPFAVQNATSVTVYVGGVPIPLPGCDPNLGQCAY